MGSVVIGCGSYLPSRQMSNDEFSEELNTSDEWIYKRTGIKYRHIADDTETTSMMATYACNQAIQRANIDKNEIDLIIVATATPDLTFPSTAVLVQRNLGIGEKCVAFDINAACSGFVFAIDVMDCFLRAKRAKCALVIGAEKFSKILNWQDRSTCVLFGDGAGAMVFKYDDNSEAGIASCHIFSDGQFVDFLKTSGGVSTTQNAGVVMMNGREVFRVATEKFKNGFNELLEFNKLNKDEIDWIIPHQANERIIEMFVEQNEIPREKVVVSVANHANTSAASIPLAFCSVFDKMKRREKIVFLSMGAGFTWGSALLTI